MLFNGLNGDLMKVELRDGSVYTSNGIKEFLEPVLKWLKKQYPTTHLIVRADSGFATPDLYDLCDDMDVEILVRLKANAMKKTGVQLEMSRLNLIYNTVPLIDSAAISFQDLAESSGELKETVRAFVKR